MSTSPISLIRLDPDGEDLESLLAFFTRNEFPFHVVRRPTAEQVQRWIDGGAFRSDDNDSYWVDHLAMRRTFLRCGWLKEAHYREGWPVEGGTPVASVAYAILRRDWESGTTTPFVWEDLS